MKGKPLWALGCMSGTSLDGVDAALIHTDGIRVLEQGPSTYRPYAEAEREALRAVLGRWPGPGLEAAAAVVARAHAEVIARFDRPDVVGFHGQTLAHAPRAEGTHQLGDGAALAREVGCPVVWDFRSVDVSLGGEGALGNHNLFLFWRFDGRLLNHRRRCGRAGSQQQRSQQSEQSGKHLFGQYSNKASNNDTSSG